MSCTEDKSLHTELAQLECHFTWDMRKEDTNITDHLTRLEQHRDLNLGEKAGTAQTHNSLAYVKYLLGPYDEALTSLQKSVELIKECNGDNYDRKLIVTYGNFAWLHYHMKQYAECKSYLENVREIKEKNPPDSTSVIHPDVFGEKAWALFKFSRMYYGRAEECFRKALELKPDEGEWNAGYAILLYRTETRCSSPRDSSALKQLRQGVEKNPDNDELKLLLALKLAEFKLYEEAEDLVERALEMSPDSPHVIRYVGKYLRNYGSVDRSIGLLKRALEITPNSAFIHHQLGLCYNREKNKYRDRRQSQKLRQLSITHLEEAIALKSGFIIAMTLLAHLYEEDRQIDRADEVYQNTLCIAKEKPDTLQKLNLYYGDFQQYKKKCLPLAIKYYMECLKMAPNTQDGKTCARKLRKIANTRLFKYPNNAEALGILEFIEQASGHSTADGHEHVLECTRNEK